MSDAHARFRDYDFEGNPKWQQYKANLEIPVSANRDATVEKLKAKWYRREVDPQFDASASVTSTPAPDATPPPQPRQEVPSNGQKGNRQTSQPAPAQQKQSDLLSRIKGIIFLKPQDRSFFLHLLVIVFALIHLQPFFSTPSSWSRFLQAAALTQGYKVNQRFGLPTVWPFKLDNVANYFKSVSSTTDFQYLMLAMVFIPSRPLLLVMVPFVTLAVYHVAAYAATHYSHTSIWNKYCTKPYQWLATRQQHALVVNAAAEIGTGFLVILNLLTPPRNPFLVFIHWQWLRMRFWSPDSANNHRLVWSQLDSKFGRYLDMLPILKTPIGYIQRWFQSAATMQQR